MNTLPSFLIKFFTLTLFILLLFPHSSYAQKDNICENEDCLPDIFSVELNEPSKPFDGKYAPQRTENFKKAYLSFIQVSSQYNQSAEWQNKYTDFQLGGTNCLRHYKLESAFAHEYLQNTDFRKFIDEEIGINADFKKAGFASSRRALNLENRMKSKCSKEIKKVFLENLPTEYNALGVDLGYFDTQGNMLKPLPATAIDSESTNKKEQIDQLKIQVASLPIGTAMTTKIDALRKDLSDLNVKQISLKNSNSDIEALLNMIFPKQNSLQIRLDELPAKSGNLSKQKLDLIKSLQNLTDKSNELNNSFLDQKQELDNTTKTLQQTEDKLNGLNNTLADLNKTKSTLTALLEDKPKKILDELKQKVADIVKQSNDLSKKIEDGEKTKNRLLDKLNNLIKSKDKLFDDISDNDKKLDGLAVKADGFSQKILSEEACKESLVKVSDAFAPASQKQSWFGKRMGQLKDAPQKLLNRISDIRALHSDLIAGKKGVLEAKTAEKLEYLAEKAKILGEATKLVLARKDKLQTRMQTLDTKVNTTQESLESSSKSGDCAALKALEDALEELKNQQDIVEAQLKELEEDIKNTKEQTDEIEQDTKRATDLLNEEKRLQETYGKNIKLEPVSQKEWSESFAVKRQYWEAAFHPDDEVVEGFKGKYFQVKLKDAEKNVKLLFGPGKYFMSKSDFRDSYGATIGAFVSEALNFTKKDDKNKVILFIQGSADIVGQNTFKGKLNSDFLYTEVNVLPQKDGSESFGSNPIAKNISTKNFTNADLPDLRGNFLKEMISVYAKKLDPVLLEGAVKTKVDTAERNAVIYLFIPEALLED